MIERAKGRLMERENLSEAEAFRRLRKTAMNTRRPMVEVAADVLADERTQVSNASAPAGSSRSFIGAGPRREQFSWVNPR